MALIQCPECGMQISNKSAACVYCGLPSSYFPKLEDEQRVDNNPIQTITETSTQTSISAGDNNIDYNEIKNTIDTSQN